MPHSHQRIPLRPAPSRRADTARRVPSRRVTPSHPIDALQAGAGNRAARAYVQTRLRGTGPAAAAPRVPPRLETTIEAARGHGHALPAGPRRRFEAGTGADVSHVRVHADSRAADAADQFRARAFTVGSDIFFARGHYRPESASGQRLVGHELTHVLQQAGGTARASPMLRRQPDPTAGTPKAPPEYVPPLGAPERQRKGSTPEELGRLDLDEIFRKNTVLRTRVEKVATTLDLDPGFLAANLFAEESDPAVWSRTSGEVASELLGLDDWFDPTMGRYIRRVLRAHPGLGFRYGDVRNTGKMWNVGTEKAGAGLKPRGKLPARKAVAAIGVYIKAAETMLERRLSNQGLRVAYNVLSPEERLTVLRLTFNAGIRHGEKLVRDLHKGGDILRTGKTTRDPDNPSRTAVLHVARAIHLGQVVFGRGASAYRPLRPGTVPERIDARKSEEIQESLKRAGRQHRVGEHEIPPPAQ